jgi:hypothetical protein
MSLHQWYHFNPQRQLNQHPIALLLSNILQFGADDILNLSSLSFFHYSSISPSLLHPFPQPTASSSCFAKRISPFDVIGCMQLSLVFPLKFYCVILASIGVYRDCIYLVRTYVPSSFVRMHEFRIHLQVALVPILH